MRWALTLMKDYAQGRTEISSKQYKPCPRSVRQIHFDDQTPRKLKQYPHPTSGNVEFVTTVCGETMTAAKLTYCGCTVSDLVHMYDVIHSRINKGRTAFGRPRSTMYKGRQVSLQANYICTQTFPH